MLCISTRLDLVNCGQLAVLPDAKQQAIERTVLEALETEAVANGLAAVFAFTYVPQFFARLGFSEVERGELPLNVWKHCLRCPKFHNCDGDGGYEALMANCSGTGLGRGGKRQTGEVESASTHSRFSVELSATFLRIP